MRSWMSWARAYTRDADFEETDLSDECSTISVVYVGYHVLIMALESGREIAVLCDGVKIKTRVKMMTGRELDSAGQEITYSFTLKECVDSGHARLFHVHVRETCTGLRLSQHVELMI